MYAVSSCNRRKGDFTVKQWSRKTFRLLDNFYIHLAFENKYSVLFSLTEKLITTSQDPIYIFAHKTFPLSED